MHIIQSAFNDEQLVFDLDQSKKNGLHSWLKLSLVENITNLTYSRICGGIGVNYGCKCRSSWGMARVFFLVMFSAFFPAAVVLRFPSFFASMQTWTIQSAREKMLSSSVVEPAFSFLFFLYITDHKDCPQVHYSWTSSFLEILAGSKFTGNLFNKLTLMSAFKPCLPPCNRFKILLRYIKNGNPSNWCHHWRPRHQKRWSRAFSKECDY